MAILKIYTSPSVASLDEGPSNRCHIIEKACNVVVHQGHYILPQNHELVYFTHNDIAAPNDGLRTMFGPSPFTQFINFYDAIEGDPVKIVDYTEESGTRIRALIKDVCYICSEETGKTIERAEVTNPRPDRSRVCDAA